MRNAILLIALSIFCLALFVGCLGCYTEKKAESQVTKAGIKFPKVLADISLRLFPFKETVDSSDYVKARNRIDSIIMVNELEKLLNESERNKLLEDIYRLGIDSLTQCDSLIESVYRYAASERRRGDNLERKVNQLTESIKHIPPKIEIKEDGRIKFSLTKVIEEKQLEADECEDELSETEQKLSKTKQQRSKWRLWCLLTWAALAVYSYIRFKTKIFNLFK